jgi:hypothetical protein
VQK